MSFVDNETFARYRELCEQRWSIRFVEKRSSWLMRALGIVLFFNKKFMSTYITTVGTTIYWPDVASLDREDFPVLFHEAQHAHDFKRFSILMSVSYLLPQILTILIIGAFAAICGSTWWLLWLCAIVFLLPFPSFTRTFWEIRGYSCNFAYDIWCLGVVRQELFENTVANFTTSAYYFMYPFRRSIEKRLRIAEKKILDGELTEVQRVTHDFLEARGIVEAEL